MSIGTENQHAIVLSGGGAYGAYGLGVMEALFSGRWRRGQATAVDPTVFTGTSVGSINAAYMVAESGSRTQPGCLAAVRALRQIWLDRIAETASSDDGVFRLRGDARRYFANPIDAVMRIGEDALYVARQSLVRGPQLALSEGSLMQRLLQQIDLASLVSTTPLQQLVSDVIVPARILDPESRTLKIATTNWDTGQVVVFRNKREEARVGKDTSTKAKYAERLLTEEDTVDAVLASAAIPGVFPPIEMDGDNYVDGGLLMNTPLHPAIAADARTLHVVYLDPKLERIPRGEVQGTAYTLDRLMAVTFANIKEDIEYARLMRRLIATANRIQRLSGNVATDPVVGNFLADFADMTELTVHRYFPSRSLGDIYGMLDFRQGRLIDITELGFDDTARHDCHANGCLTRETD